MEIAIAAAAFSFALTAVLFLTARTALWSGRDAALEKAGRELGLEVVEGGLDGFIDDFAVTVPRWEGGGRRFEVTVDGRGREEGGIPQAFRLAGERGLFKGGDTLVGDHLFDVGFHVESPPRLAAAMLGIETREALLGSGGDCLVEGGKVTLTVDKGTGGAAALVGSVREALGVARRLARGAKEGVRALARNAVSDPVPGVRLRNLELLLAHHRGEEETGRTLRALLGDGNPEVLFRAAMALGDEGLPALKGLVEREEEQFAAAALTHLAGRLPRGELRPLLARAATTGREELRCAALEAVARLADPALEESVAQGLSSESPKVRIAAVKALGAVGTATSVPLLRGIDVKLLDVAMRRAVGDAVSRIQGRLEGAGKGQVSLTEGEEADGRVSLADDRRGGRLTLEAGDD